MKRSTLPPLLGSGQKVGKNFSLSPPRRPTLYHIADSVLLMRICLPVLCTPRSNTSPVVNFPFLKNERRKWTTQRCPPPRNDWIQKQQQEVPRYAEKLRKGEYLRSEARRKVIPLGGVTHLWTPSLLGCPKKGRKVQTPFVPLTLATPLCRFLKEFDDSYLKIMNLDELELLCSFILKRKNVQVK